MHLYIVQINFLICSSDSSLSLSSPLGTKANRWKYTIVIHGVPKADIDPNKDDQEMLTAKNKEDNESRNLSTVQVLPLWQTGKHLDKATWVHHLLIIFTQSQQEADSCI